jgi:methylmalonyl-CoA mutase
MRLAEPYERLRDASDAHLARTGERPRIFLADLGPVAAFTARATFAKALFEAGGIEAPLNDGFLTPDAAAEAFRASGARIACLCSSDAVYEEMAVDAARALKRAGAERLYLAGRPREGGEDSAPGGHEARYREAGIDGFVFAGCDALDILGEAHRSLGLARA